MFSFTSHLKIYLTLTPQDLRKSLQTDLEDQLKRRLCDGGLHLFINKAHTLLKLLHCHGTGTSCSTKRLEQGTFNWPFAR